MRIWYAKFYIDLNISVKEVHAPTLQHANALGARYAAAASRVLGLTVEFVEVTEEYPPDLLLNENKVSDLEYMSRRMKGGNPA